MKILLKYIHVIHIFSVLYILIEFFIMRLISFLKNEYILYFFRVQLTNIFMELTLFLENQIQDLIDYWKNVKKIWTHVLYV